VHGLRPKLPRARARPRVRPNGRSFTARPPSPGPNHTLSSFRYHRHRLTRPHARSDAHTPTNNTMTDPPSLTSYYAQPPHLAHSHSLPSLSGYPTQHRTNSLAVDPRTGALSHGGGGEVKAEVGSPRGNGSGKRRMSSVGEGEEGESDLDEEGGDTPGGGAGGGTPGGAPGKKPRKRNRQALSCTVSEPTGSMSVIPAC